MHHIERHSTDSTLWISSMAGLQLRHVPSKYLVSKYLESKYIVSKYVHNTGCIIRYYTTIRIIHNTAAFWPYCCTLVRRCTRVTGQVVFARAVPFSGLNTS